MWRTWQSCSLTQFVNRFVTRNNKILNHRNQMLNDINQKVTLSSTLCKALPWRHLRSQQILPSLAQPGQHRARQQKRSLQWLVSLLESFLLPSQPGCSQGQVSQQPPPPGTRCWASVNVSLFVPCATLWEHHLISQGHSAQAAAFKEPPQNNLCSPWFYWVGHNI